MNQHFDDQAEILALESWYGPTYDLGDAVAWADLFTQDGIYQSRDTRNGPAPNYIEGRENLERFCLEQPQGGIHSLQLPAITVDGSTAIGRISFQFELFKEDANGISHLRKSMGVYDVKYSRTVKGWRIARRITSFVKIETLSLFGGYPSRADLDAPSPYQGQTYVDTR